MDYFVVIGVIVASLVALVASRLPPSSIFLFGVLVLVSFRVISPGEAIQGVANEGLVTVALLYIIAQGIHNTGGIHALVRLLLTPKGSLWRAQGRMMVVVATLSAVLNNTPVVATFLPAIREWAKSRGLPASKLLIPLSYAAILGGTCTIIGSSTNVVTNGLLIKLGGEGIGFFKMAWVGLPCTVVGVVYVMLVSRWLLPDRKATSAVFENTKEYTVELMIQPDCELVGCSVGEAGLRQLTGLYLVEVFRSDRVIAPVTPELKLSVEDRLVFTGLPESIADLRKIRGLVPAESAIFELRGMMDERCFIEAVVSRENPLVGKTIRDGRFRTQYGAAVLAVSRHGERIPKKIGDIQLKASDTLLLEGHSSFVDLYRNSREFLLLNLVEDSELPEFEKAWIAWLCVISMVLLAAFEVISILHGAMLATAVMFLTGCCSVRRVRNAIDLHVLLVLAASLAYGLAIQKTGLGGELAQLLSMQEFASPWLLLVLVYVITMVLTELITNMAAAVLAFSVTAEVVLNFGYDMQPFTVAIMIAASASFISPIGYQTNLMVYGPGGYCFTDFLKIGGPLSVIVAVIALSIIPMVWPLA